jgi:hypothetical protein
MRKRQQIASNQWQAAQSRPGTTRRSVGEKQAFVLKELKKVPVPHCGATTTIGETTPIGDK